MSNHKEYHRCACCGRTNNPDLISTQDDYTPGPFFEVVNPKYPWDVECQDCVSSINGYTEGYDSEEFDLYSLYEHSPL